VSPILQTSFGLRDMGYGSGLEASGQHSSMSSQRKSQSSQTKTNLFAISRTQDL